MTMHVKAAGSWHETAPSIKEGGVWKPIRQGWIKDAGTWKEFFAESALIASASPATAFGEGVGAASVTSNTVTVSVTGGIAPYTYSWSRVSGATFVILNPTSPTTAFNAFVPYASTLTGIYRCTISHAGLGTTYVDVPVELSTTF